MNCIRSLLFFSFPLCLCACVQKPQQNFTQLSGEGIGTYYQVTYCDSLERDFKPAVDSILVSMNQLFSIFLKSSVIEEWNRSSKGIEDAEFATLTREAIHYSRLSGGAFDPTVGPLVRSWGFGPEKKQIPDSAQVAELLSRTGIEHLSVRGDSIVKDMPEILLDYNGIAKGYTVDKVALFLESQGVRNYLVNIGGEVRAEGKSPRGTAWILGIETPQKGFEFGKSVIRRLELTGRALATSGNYRSFHQNGSRTWGHTINPKTGFPEENPLQSATVLAPTCTMADAIATALMVLGTERAQRLVEELEGVEAVLISNFSTKEDSVDFTLWYSSGMAALLLDDK